MNLSLKIAPHIAHLRRFSRDLTGDKASGDTYVAALLEAIMAEHSMLDAAADVKVALYQQFCELWESIPFTVRMKEPAERHAAISPKAREAFLLTEVEGFASHEVGQILSCDPDVVAKLIGEASSAFSHQIDTDVRTIRAAYSNGYKRETGLSQQAHFSHCATGAKNIEAELEKARMAGSG